MTDSECDWVRAEAAEFVLGVSSGEERAQVLAHLRECRGCRRWVAELADVADELLILVPGHDPPLGFESRVVAGLTAPDRQRRRHRSPVLALAAALAAAALTASVFYLGFRADRQLAGQYRAALARVDGSYFQAARLRTADGTAAGKVFGYQGNPSWLFLVVYKPYRGSPFQGILVTRQGRVPLANLQLDAETGSWGGAIPVALHDVTRVILVRTDDGRMMQAAIPPGPPGAA